jgi:hypothetical protein
MANKPKFNQRTLAVVVAQKTVTRQLMKNACIPVNPRNRGERRMLAAMIKKEKSR